MRRKLMKEIKDGKRLTWDEIVKNYPNQQVGLSDVIWNEKKTAITSAIVRYTAPDTDKREMTDIAWKSKGKIQCECTTDELEFLLGGKVLTC